MNNKSKHIPNPPWVLKGVGAQALFFTKRKDAGKLLPPGTRIINFGLGYTLGLVSLGFYGEGSTMQYNELIVSPAFIKSSGKRGTIVEHIVVDSRRSVQGGRDYWKLDKKLGEFSQDGKKFQCSFEQKKVTLYQKAKLLPVPWIGFSLRAFSDTSRIRSSFKGRIRARGWLSIIEIKVEGVSSVPSKNCLGFLITKGELRALAPDIINDNE